MLQITGTSGRFDFPNSKGKSVHSIQEKLLLWNAHRPDSGRECHYGARISRNMVGVAGDHLFSEL
jgi:hypothetical protein